MRSRVRTAPGSPIRRRARPAARRRGRLCCSFSRRPGSGFPNVDPPGKSMLANEDLALFAQDQWQIRLERHAQLRPALGRAADGRHGRSVDDGVCAVSEQPGLSVRRHDSQSGCTVPAACRCLLGRQVESPDRRPRQLRLVLRPQQHAEPGRIGHRQRAAEPGRRSRARDRPGSRRSPDADLAGTGRDSTASSGSVSAVHRRAHHRVRLQESANHDDERGARAGSWRRTGRCISTTPIREATT